MRSVVLSVLIFFTLLSSAYTKDASDLKTVEVTVTRVSDGDTLELREPIPGFSDGGKVRMLGVQAFEEHDDTTGIPDCNATNATTRLGKILGCNPDNSCPPNTKVTLKVWDTSLQNLGRPWRYVFLGDLNVGLQLVEEGYVVAFAHPDETLYNNDLFRAQQRAINNESGPLWNSTESQCEVGPGEGSQLQMWVNWDAPGDDSLPENRNGEWIKIKNNGVSSVDLSYWKIRDTGQQHLWEFPSGASVSAGGTITVKVGSGTNTGTTFYMEQSSAMFENTIPEGVFLLDYWESRGTDVYGSIRAHFTYPCLTNCSDPLEGKVQMTVNYDAPGDDSTNPNGEWVKLKNISSGDIDLAMYLLHSDPIGSATYNFDGNSVVHAGETLQVFVGNGSDSRLEKYWGNSTSIMTNSEDRIWLDTYDSIKIIEVSWPEAVSEPLRDISIIPVINLLME